jgi:ribosome-binding factor A
MASELRATRVGEVIRAEIADMLSRGLKDPRIGFVSIMGVRMSPDLRYANVYVSLLGSESEQKSSMIGLRRSAGWIRRELGKKMHLRYTPEVRFFEDESLDDVFHLEERLREMHESGEFDSADDATESKEPPNE